MVLTRHQQEQACLASPLLPSVIFCSFIITSPTHPSEAGLLDLGVELIHSPCLGAAAAQEGGSATREEITDKSGEMATAR